MGNTADGAAGAGAATSSGARASPASPTMGRASAVTTRSRVDEDSTITFEQKLLFLAYNFWKDKVSTLDRSQQKILGLLLFSNLFKRSKEARALFTTTDITRQSLRLLDMFGWLLRTLDSRDAKMRSKTLTALGERHVAYGVKSKFFEPMFDALHQGLSEMFDDEYTDEVAKAIRRLFTQAGEQMMLAEASKGPDVPSIRWLASIEFALADPVGFTRLTQYLHLEGVKAGEFAEFHRAFQIYRSTLDDETRKQVGAEIFRVFFSREAMLPIKGFPGLRKLEYDVSSAMAPVGELPLDVFDAAHQFVKRQILEHHWAGFKEVNKDFVPGR